MNLQEKKDLVREFLLEFENPEPAKLETMVADDFVWKVMTHMEGMPPVKGKAGLKDLVRGLKTMMPGGLGMKFSTIICEGDHCAVQAESNTTAANGKKYNNMYHFYIRFAGDKIAEVREYCDTNHAREVFLAQ